MPLTLLIGLSLALLVSIVSPLLAFAAIGALLFLIVFVQRPDLGLLITLFIRSFTDLTVSHGIRSAPGTIFSSPVNVGLILILILSGGLFLLSRGVPFLSLPGGIPIALLLLTGVIGLVRAAGVEHSESTLYGLQQWLRAASALVVYALAAHVFRSPQRIQRVIDVLAASFVVPACVGFYQIVTHQGILNYRSTIVQTPGTFVHQNAFGFFLVVIFGVFLGQVLVHSGIRRLLALSIVAASGVLLVATFSRSAWLGALVVLLIVGAFRKQLFLILTPLVVILVFVTVPSVSQRFSDPFGGSFASRAGIWQSTAPEWISATHDDAGSFSTLVNRLIGTGPGSAAFLVLRGYGLATEAHNDYLRVLFEYGALGLGAYLSVYLAILISGCRTWRRCTDERMASIVISFIALIFGFMVMSLTENIFGDTQNQIYFWTMAGLTAAISKLSIESSGNPFPANA